MLKLGNVFIVVTSTSIVFVIICIIILSLSSLIRWKLGLGGLAV